MVEIARDPHYRPVLYVLIKHQNQPISLREIAERSNYSLATVKRHLRALKLLNVVSVHGSRESGVKSLYSVDKTIERLVIAN